MIIKVKKEIEETLEVKTPSFYETFGQLSKITENGVITLLGTQGSILTENINAIPEMLEHGKEVSEEVFMERFNQIMSQINALAGVSDVPTLAFQS